MDMAFQADPKVAQIAEAYALDAIDLAANFNVKLDWTDDSIALVETILGTLHGSIHEKPPEEVIWGFAKALGSYVGEVFRKNHGGEWGMISDGGSSFPGIRSKGKMFWPWARAHQRIVGGPENNVWDYYRIMTSG